MTTAIGKKNIAIKERPPIAKDTNRAISEYFLSKSEEQTAIKHYPEWDLVKGEPEIELMRVRRELLTADLELQAKREEHQQRRELADRQWQELREKENLLRRSFLRFDEFVKENREKRERAVRKTRDEKERQKIREAEIAELEKNLEYLEKVRDKMQNYVEEYKPFQQYLETVLETKEFQSIAEIFNRYETLIAARTTLVQNQDDNLQALENTTAQLQKMTEEKSQNLMDLNSRLAQLQSRHEQARAKSLHWETVVSKVKEVASRKELEETQVRACIWNLYRQICRRKGVAVEAKRDDLELQLLHVKRTILELGKIVRAAKRKTAREEKQKELERTAAANKDEKCPADLRREETRSSFRSGFDETCSFRRN
ncbi:coiled-coil domain-containing protein 42 homolog [Nasonia vitripennis]|uniref:DUF4200 domain-containing protein n=1 Tax=Nasonia vitripennis TaxID=7425 RepID=A0A7M7LMF5_NASVI|nr:coiled-coil domain-containing protein 42 homolog [Nasonia vitripennis]